MEFKISKSGYMINRGLKQWNMKLCEVIFIICLMTFIPVIQSKTISENIGKIPNTCETDIENRRIFCTDVHVNDLTSKIEKEVDTFPNEVRTIEKLTINNLSIDNKTLYQNWINTTNFRIRRIAVNSPNIEAIENNAFNSYAFTYLQYLNLNELKIDTLEEGTFAGLRLLLDILIENCEINHIHENTLKAVAPTLGSLYFKNIKNTFNPVNLTGTVPLPLLTVIGFGFNRMASLDEKSFSQVRKPRYVNLQLSRIENIGCGTFENMKSVDQLILEDSGLTTLDPCVFGDELINNMQNDVLYLGYNPWNCNCDLEWLKELKIKNKIKDNPLCASHGNLPFEEVDFC